MNAAEKLQEYLFYNPASTCAQISEMTGISIFTIRKAVKEKKELFETISAGVENDNKKKRLVFLTRNSQIAYSGRNISPVFLADTIAMNWSRLRIARKHIINLRKETDVFWCTSPWQPSRKSIFFDALALVKNNNARGHLVAFYANNDFMDEYIYGEVIKEWVNWRKRTQAFSASLVFLSPKFTLAEAKYLKQGLKENNGYVVCWTGDDYSPWIYLLEYQDVTRTHIPPWGTKSDSPLGVYEQGFLIPFARKTPHPNAQYLSFWLKTPTGQNHSINNLLKLNQASMILLKWISLFPASSEDAYKQYYSRISPHSDKTIIKKYRKNQKSLLDLKLIKEIESMRGHYILTFRGIECLGTLHGIPEKYLIKRLGIPQQEMQYKFQQEHTRSVYKTFSVLSSEGLLTSCNISGVQQAFYEIKLAFGDGSKFLYVHPDAAGSIRFSNNKEYYFWMELDRGTRKGKKFKKQLEKYFLIHFAKYRSLPIPPIIYLMDTKPGMDEIRLKGVVKKLIILHQKYPGTPLKVILSTSDLIAKYNGDVAGKKVWRTFHKGEFDSQLCNLMEAFN